MQVLKIGLFGNSGAGKSCIVKRQCDGIFEKNPGQTIGVDFKSTEVQIIEENGWGCLEKNIKLQIWDTAGHERFHCIARSYYRIIGGIILCYDVTDTESMEGCRSSWLPAIFENCEDPIIVLAGCKADNETNYVSDKYEINPIIREIIDKYPDNIKKHIFCSSRLNVNIESIFRTITQEVYNRVNPIAELESESTESPTVNVHSTQPHSNNCCI